MKLKKLKIEVGSSLRDSLHEFAEIYGKIKRGEQVEPLHKISFPTFEIYRKTLSKKRMHLLKVVKKNKFGSIYELAKTLDRDYKNVYDDVKNLRMLGFISKKELKVTFDKLVLEIPV